MGNPNTGEIYEGMLRNEGDVPLNQEQAAWLKELPLRDRMTELQAMAQKSQRSETANAPAFDRNMPHYKCHKEVWAFKIAEIRGMPDKPTIAELEAILADKGSENVHIEPSGDVYAATGAEIVPADEGYESFFVSADYMRKHNPQVGGYYVIYADGYRSFSPAQAFEKGYTRI